MIKPIGREGTQGGVGWLVGSPVDAKILLWFVKEIGDVVSCSLYTSLIQKNRMLDMNSWREESSNPMRPESNSAGAAESSSSSAAAAAASAASSSPSPSGKRAEILKMRFTSTISTRTSVTSASLNGLTVGDPLPENLMESPARSETMFYPRDEMSLQYSPMSDDSDDSRFCENPINTCSSQPDSVPSSPVSPYRYQRPLTGFPSTCSSTSQSSNGCTVTNFNCSQPRQRGSDSEGRFPSSPSDICHSADLRRAALLRSVQMRTQPFAPPSDDMAFSSGQEPVSNIEAEERSCPYMKSLVDEREYPIAECSSMGISEPDFKQEKSCRMLDMDEKGNHSAD
ncbi:hypothetical protein Prudu_018269 [Prunus dulcis]|uniref:Uncharacterized protein n=1 Tax=Prunus dulcis TaxID=3755 RepID=A0A4Y1RRZ6_PRUDU|nr:hypothetical protein Prudu_018269 [Prunus dulcis]